MDLFEKYIIIPLPRKQSKQEFIRTFTLLRPARIPKS